MQESTSKFITMGTTVAFIALLLMTAIPMVAGETTEVRDATDDIVIVDDTPSKKESNYEWNLEKCTLTINGPCSFRLVSVVFEGTGEGKDINVVINGNVNVVGYDTEPAFRVETRNGDISITGTGTLTVESMELMNSNSDVVKNANIESINFKAESMKSRIINISSLNLNIKDCKEFSVKCNNANEKDAMVFNLNKQLTVINSKFSMESKISITLVYCDGGITIEHGVDAKNCQFIKGDKGDDEWFDGCNIICAKDNGGSFVSRDEDKGNGNSIDPMIIAVIAIVIVLIVAAILFYFFYYRKKMVPPAVTPENQNEQN